MRKTVRHVNFAINLSYAINLVGHRVFDLPKYLPSFTVISRDPVEGDGRELSLSGECLGNIP